MIKETDALRKVVEHARARMTAAKDLGYANGYIEGVRDSISRIESMAVLSPTSKIMKARYIMELKKLLKVKTEDLVTINGDPF